RLRCRTRARSVGRRAAAYARREWRTAMVIKLGSRRVRGVVYGDLLEIEIALDANGRAWPDGEWIELFREYADFPPDLEEPRLEHGKLRFEASDDDLSRAWTAIKHRVATTNRMYEAG